MRDRASHFSRHPLNYLSEASYPPFRDVWS
jgi:hypothetical protein